MGLHSSGLHTVVDCNVLLFSVGTTTSSTQGLRGPRHATSLEGATGASVQETSTGSSSPAHLPSANTQSSQQVHARDTLETRKEDRCPDLHVKMTAPDRTRGGGPRSARLGKSCLLSTTSGASGEAAVLPGKRASMHGPQTEEAGQRSGQLQTVTLGFCFLV